MDVGNNRNYYFCLRYISADLKSLKISNISLKEVFYQRNQHQNLKHLDASFNKLSSLMNLDNYRNLIHLDLKFNMIDDIKIASTKNYNLHMLSELKFLNMNKSLTKYLTNFELKLGKNLETAILSDNYLKNIPKFCEQDSSQRDIKEFSCNLKTLYFDHNKLDTIKQIDFIFLEKLEYMNLDSNYIGSIEDDSFFNLKSLETLILSNNKLNLTNSSQALFNSLTNIKILNLGANLIEIIRMNSFQDLLKLEVLDLSNNKIYAIEKDSFNGLLNLRDLYLNGNEPHLKIENSSFIQLEDIKTIFIDEFILNNSLHKSTFIDLVKNKNILHNKTILKWNFFQALNLITLNESYYDCGLVIELLRFNIQYNLKTESDFGEYLENCQSMYLMRKDYGYYIIQKDKLAINYLYFFIAFLSLIVIVAITWIFNFFFRRVKVETHFFLL